MRTRAGLVAAAFALVACDSLSGGAGGGAGGPGKPCGSTDKLVFVTQSLFAANDGRSGADGLCNTEAGSGSYVAWLSQTGSGALARLPTGVGWCTSNHARVVDDTGDLAHGVLQQAIDVDAKGTTISADAKVWTGTDASGGAAGSDCSEWTETGSGEGRVGSAGSTHATWTDLDDEPCSTAAHVYCFQK